MISALFSGPKQGVEVRPARRPLAEPRTHERFPAGRAGRVKVTLPGRPAQPPEYTYVVAIKRLLGSRALDAEISSLIFPVRQGKLPSPNPATGAAGG
jgi:hypothetical protein